MFTNDDINAIKNTGVSFDQVVQQLETFNQGIPFVNLKKPATIGDGILQLSESSQQCYISIFDNAAEKLRTVNFIPASGAATRMFKKLIRFLEEYDYNKQSLNAFTNLKGANEIRLFLIGITKFPFFKEVFSQIKNNYPEFDNFKEGHKLYLFVEALISSDGFGYGDFPKGLLPFHNYKGKLVTAFEEHLNESKQYNRDKDNKTYLHFTVDASKLKSFQEKFQDIQDQIESQNKASYEVSYSLQDPKTKTIAVDLDNQPFRDDSGKLVFRPAGHGALIVNLNQIDADLIFIKNIDNVVVKEYQAEVATYKKILGGILIQIQKEIFEILNLLDQEKQLSQSEIHRIKDYMECTLNICFPLDFEKFSDFHQLDFLYMMLHRPIRVCGMVVNEGEPGGGPFWVKKDNGCLELQIVESSQVNKDISKQQKILQQSTHFNPVDIICGVRDYKGEKFDLTKYVDQQSGFITEKSYQGRVLKALELPGLWNGAMSNWNTLFVEVPLLTFNPVKSVTDLLKSAHQVHLF